MQRQPKPYGMNTKLICFTIVVQLLSTAFGLCTPPAVPSELRDVPYLNIPASASCAAAPLDTGLLKIRVRGGFIVELYCANFKEFLLLPRSFDDSTVNFAQTQTVRTHYCAVRLDPATLLVDVGDLSFAKNEGTTSTWGMYGTAAYGAAAECRGGQIAHANIDLRGTPFAVADGMSWVQGGFLPRDISAI